MGVARASGGVGVGAARCDGWAAGDKPVNIPIGGPWMQKLISIVIATLACLVGWYAGSWKGRDAVEAVARYRKLAEDADAALGQAQARLTSDLAAKEAKFDAELKALSDAHVRQIRDYDARVAGNAKEIARLTQVSAAHKARIAALTRQRDAAPTTLERARLDTEIKAEVVVQSTVSDEIDGRRCLSMAVPPSVLSDWQAVTP